MEILASVPNYYLRLQINTVTNLSVNFMCIYLVLRYSTKAMGNYKYYILFNVISTMIMDFHITCVYGIMLLFPSPIQCASSPLRYIRGYYFAGINYVSFTRFYLLINEICYLGFYSFNVKRLWIVSSYKFYLPLLFSEE